MKFIFSNILIFLFISNLFSLDKVSIPNSYSEEFNLLKINIIKAGLVCNTPKLSNDFINEDGDLIIEQIYKANFKWLKVKKEIQSENYFQKDNSNNSIIIKLGSEITTISFNRKISQAVNYGYTKYIDTVNSSENVKLFLVDIITALLVESKYNIVDVYGALSFINEVGSGFYHNRSVVPPKSFFSSTLGKFILDGHYTVNTNQSWRLYNDSINNTAIRNSLKENCGVFALNLEINKPDSLLSQLKSNVDCQKELLSIFLPPKTRTNTTLINLNKINSDTLQFATVVDMGDDKIVYLDARSTRNLRKSISLLKKSKVNYYILDLRFYPRQKLYSVCNTILRRGNNVAILINEDTKSYAEILCIRLLKKHPDLVKTFGSKSNQSMGLVKNSKLNNSNRLTFTKVYYYNKYLKFNRYSPTFVQSQQIVNWVGPAGTLSFSELSAINKSMTK